MNMITKSNTNITIGMDKNKYSQIFLILQLAGGNFPVGGFSQSWGLETYVEKGIIKNAEEFESFLEVFLNHVLCRSEAPFVIFAHRDTNNWNSTLLTELNQLAISMKLTKESREATVKAGKAMLRIGNEILQDKEIEIFYEENKDKEIHFAVAFGIIAAKMSIDIEETVIAYIFSSINTLIQNAIKLIPLGNVEAQKLFYKINQSLSDSVDKSFAVELEDVSNFTPGLDFASIDHEDLRTRIYMS